MTCFSSDVGRLNITAPDPFKRVNYSLGMVLGVDDFRQEQEYHIERVRWLARDLLGYGTIRGLAVIPEVDGAKGWRLLVTRGTALSPSGQLICVPVDQCCNLNEWLAAQAQDKKKKEQLDNAVVTGSPVDRLTLHLVLSFQECLTDNAPIPGEPCRSEAELMQPSRLKDSFCLELRYAPPAQLEEDALRDFVTWLEAVPIDDGSPSMSTQDFLAALRAAADGWLAVSPPLSPPTDFMFGSPPADLRISRDQWRAALRLWITELRPQWSARYGCGAAPPLPPTADDAVLLAELEVPLLAGSEGWVVSDIKPLEKHEELRPFVLHLRLLQEMIIRSNLNVVTSP